MFGIGAAEADGKCGNRAIGNTILNARMPRGAGILIDIRII